MTNINQRDELSRFLKDMRARVKPSEVGLPQMGRRRTQGLRREEVASLAGMSVTWYTWFEQGREVQLSAPLLERLSRTLRLGPEEREYLFALAQHRPPPPKPITNDKVSAGTQHMLDGIHVPAQVITEDWTVIGWNRIVTKLFRDYGSLPVSERNLFKILLLNERYRTDPEEYRAMAKRLTARFKWDYSRTARVELFEAIIAEMLEQAEAFREFWADSTILAHLEHTHTISDDEVGDITFRHSSYAIEGSPGQRLMLFVPVDQTSRDRMEQVASRP